MENSLTNVWFVASDLWNLYFRVVFWTVHEQKEHTKGIFFVFNQCWKCILLSWKTIRRKRNLSSTSFFGLPFFFLCWTYKLCASCGFKSKSNVILGSLQFFMMEKNLSNVWSVFFVMYLIMVFKRFMIERNLSNAHFVILNQQNCIFESEFVKI